eukprot:780461-Amphidinium_carterae.1
MPRPPLGLPDVALAATKEEYQPNSAASRTAPGILSLSKTVSCKRQRSKSCVKGSRVGSFTHPVHGRKPLHRGGL